MDQLIATCTREAREIRQAVADVARAISATWWQGDDADRFRNEWEARHHKHTLAVAEELESLARYLRDQLATQRNVSSR